MFPNTCAYIGQNLRISGNLASGNSGMRGLGVTDCLYFYESFPLKITCQKHRYVLYSKTMQPKRQHSVLVFFHSMHACMFYIGHHLQAGAQ